MRTRPQAPSGKGCGGCRAAPSRPETWGGPLSACCASHGGGRHCPPPARGDLSVKSRCPTRGAQKSKTLVTNVVNIQDSQEQAPCATCQRGFGGDLSIKSRRP
eukprot:1175840-Prorocentrum_minimum.AAC.1